MPTSILSGQLSVICVVQYHFKTMVAQSLKSTFWDETLFDVTTHPPPQSNLKKNK